MNLLLVLIIAISLSMDAFSLCLAYGTLSLSKKEINLLSIIVGIYHFIMPLLGVYFGNKILSILPIDSKLITFVVLLMIGIEMIIDTIKDKNEIKKMKYLEMLGFGLAVSIDAFSVGVGLKQIYNNYLLAALIFSITSMIFTYLGLLLGRKISKIIGRLSTLLGGGILIVISIAYII